MERSSNSPSVPWTQRAKKTLFREVIGFVALTIPIALILFAGMWIGNSVRHHRHHNFVTQPLTPAIVQAQLAHCSVFQEDTFLRVDNMQASSPDERLVNYEYRSKTGVRDHRARAEFGWKNDAWHIERCQ